MNIKNKVANSQTKVSESDFFSLFWPYSRLSNQLAKSTTLLLISVTSQAWN